MAKRVMIFIDGSNLYHSAKNVGIKVDYEKLKDVLAGDRDLIRPYLYCSDPHIQAQTNFFNKLKYIGYEVKTTELKKYGNEKPFEKGVDIMLTTDLLLYCAKDLYDIAILVTGDKDYIPAVKAVKEMGKRIEIAGFKCCTAKELVLSADKFIPLDDYINEIRFEKKI